MKIVSWNLRNVGQNKLQRNFQPVVTAFGLGNTMLDYVLNLVMGTGTWNNVPNLTTNPADIFVVIELKCGGKQKGQGAQGTCVGATTDIINGMNQKALARWPNPNPMNPNYRPPYWYDAVQPQLIVGFHETVGIFYNTQSLTYISSGVFRNLNNNQWIPPRTPFGAQFRINANNNLFQIVGIHAPPTGKGGAAMRFKPPIDFSNLLRYTQPAATASTFIMGDFNCDGGDHYTSKNGVQVNPFTGLNGFGTQLPAGTWSSVRLSLNNGMPPPQNYMSGAYDNIVYNTVFHAPPNEIVPDMIRYARNMNVFGFPSVYGTNLRALLNAFNSVSDHMPVVLEG